MEARVCAGKVLPFFLAVALVAWAPLCVAQQDMSNVSDVLQGNRDLLRDDDILALTLQEGSPGPSWQAFVATAKTSHGGVTSVTGGLLANQVDHTSQLQGYSASLAMGRLFSIDRDFGAVLSPSTFGLTATPFWGLTITDSNVDTQSVIMRYWLPGDGPTELSEEKVLTADFTGDGIDDVLALYMNTPAAAYSTPTQASLLVATAQDATSSASGLRVGPRFDARTDILVSTAAAGDFNGDGRAEIAVLDSQTNIHIYTVDPDTLAITLAASASVAANHWSPPPDGPDLPSLVAGHFRNVPHQDLAMYYAVSQDTPSDPASGWVLPISFGSQSLQPVAGNSLQLVNNTQYSLELHAVAAPLVDPMSGIDQLIGGRFDPVYGCVVDVIAFDASMNASAPIWKPLNIPNCARFHDIAVGNFDNYDQSTGSRSRQLGVVVAAGLVDGTTGVHIYDDNVNPIGPAGPSFSLPPSAIASPRLVVGDTQGRSELLGPPDKVTVNANLVPDIVLGIPPSHVDWIAPQTSGLDPAEHPGCSGPSTPCLLNLTVRPSTSASDQTPFATRFSFTESASSSSSRQSTTSWSLGGKITADAKYSYGVPDVASVSVEVKTSAAAMHDSVVSKRYNTYQKQTDQVNLTTGFSDYVFYTSRRMNYYYYPVIGRTVCPATKPQCAPDEQIPLYVVFSVPDQVAHNGVDASTQEWYQPAHEPGNVLSYPWVPDGAADPLVMLEKQYSSLLIDPISDPALNWQATDTSTSSYLKQWASATASGQTSGTTNSETFDASTTVSGSANSLVGGGTSASVTVAVNQSYSMKTVNTQDQTLGTTTGITVTKPAFDLNLASNWMYDFTAVIHGLKNPAGQSILQPPDISTDIKSTGPLVVAFLADVTRENGVGWRQSYAVHPDVALTHPERWDWQASTLTVSFNAADTSQSPSTAPLDQPFYHMKGFFVTPAAASGQGPNRSVLDAGEKYDLGVRVYNYSLEDTNTAGAARVKVRVYGQLYNTTDDSLGESFLIGDAEIGSIPGYKSTSNQGAEPNWTLASIPFDTGAFAQTRGGAVHVAFWAVVWMEDAAGNLVPEIADHGLTSNPESLTLASVTDVPFEQHSNNVGFYGYRSPLFVCPPAPSPCVGSAGGSAKLGAVRSDVTIDGIFVPDVPLDVDLPAKVIARIRTSDVAGPVTVSFYDGSPEHGGKLLDVHHISHVAANTTYLSKGKFRPMTCGRHVIYVMADAGFNAPDSNVAMLPVAVTCASRPRGGLRTVNR